MSCATWVIAAPTGPSGKVLRRHGLPPAPRRGQRSWREFVHQHADQILACDFFVVDTVWLGPALCPLPYRGRQPTCSLGWLHLPADRCLGAPQARNLAWKLEDGALRARFLLRDRDAKFSATFDEVFKSEGVRVIRLPYRRPVASSIAKRFVGICRREVLDHLLIFGQGHLERVLDEFIEHYHQARSHQRLGSSADPASPPT